MQSNYFQYPPIVFDTITQDRAVSTLHLDLDLEMNMRRLKEGNVCDMDVTHFYSDSVLSQAYLTYPAREGRIPVSFCRIPFNPLFGLQHSVEVFQ